KIVSWNVNGITSLKNYHPWTTKTFPELLDSFHSDIICFQEIKRTIKSLPTEFNHVPGYDVFYSLHPTKGYAGVATFVKSNISPVMVEQGFSGLLSTTNLGHLDDLHQHYTADTLKQLDSEGRVLITDHQYFILFNIYYPNSGETDDRHEFKMIFSKAVQIRIDSFVRAGRRVMVVGDLNVTHQEIDHCNPEQSMKDNGLAKFEDLDSRIWLNDWLYPNGLMIDTFRFSFPNRTNAFTVWNTKLNARSVNYGTRIDYILVSESLRDWIDVSDILPDVLGSDHCPIFLTLHD
ncbi:exodeoxyribonuclease III Xth, partial [Globomyces pollinis-pini]